MDYVSTVCCLLAFLLYNNTLDSGFVYDDRRAILSNPDLLPKTPWSHLLENDFWGTPLTDSGSHGSYRPVCVLTFRLNYLLGGFQPWGYHLVNVLLHCLATALLVKVARQVFPRSKSLVGTAITGLLFAAHPVHTEAVAGIVGRADLAACNFYLLSFLAYIAHVRVRDSTCCHRSVPNDYDRQTNGHKYQRLMYGLKKNISNCNWSKQLGKNVAQCDVVSNNKSCSVGNRKNSTFLQDYFKSDIKTWFYLFMSVVLAGASMLSKETGITVMGVCCIYDLACARSTKKKQWSSFIILGVTSIILLMIRLHFQPGTPQFSTADNPTAKEPRLFTRLLTFLYLPVFNFWLLLAPVSLSFDWGMDAIPRITSVGDNRNIVTVIFYTVLIMSIKKTVLQIRKKRLQEKQTIARTKKFKEIFPESKGNRGCFCKVCHTISENHTITCRNSNNNNSVNSKCVCAVPKQPARVIRENRSRSTTILLSLAFLTLPFLPATNLFFYVGFVVAERVLYLPSVGVCLLLGLAGATLWTHRRYRSLLSVILLCVLTVFSARTVVRNSDWFDEEHLYRSAIAFNPPKAFGNLGSVLSSQGRLEEAEWAFRRALQYRPNMADVHYNLAILLQGKQQLDDAILSYQRAIHFRPSLALAYVNLGAALIAAGRCQEAVAVLRQCSRLDGTGLKDRREHETAKVSALLQLGALYSEQGRLQRALAAYREAAHSLPDHYPPQSVFNVVGETLARLHQDEEAERWYQAALNAQPDHVPAHITYGKLLAKNVSRAAEAEQWFRKAQRLAPDEPSVYHHYGEFLASRRRYREAAGMYERAAELQPDDYELAVAAATAMRQAGRHLEAERWYRKAVLLKPTDARSHTNLGAILHLNGKYREAADSYKEALRLQPNDVTTLTNLHKLHSIMT